MLKPLFLVDVMPDGTATSEVWIVAADRQAEAEAMTRELVSPGHRVRAIRRLAVSRLENHTIRRAA